MQTRQHSINSERLLVFSVLIIASCGLAYELIVGALASYVLGDSVMQFSTVIGSYLFAMGIGAHLSKYIRDHNILHRFIEIELLVGLIGGISGVCLFIGFAWLPQFKALLYTFVMCIGTLVGMEIPLVIRLLNAQKNELNEVISKVLSFDYLGALIVSIIFPMVLAPTLGLARSAVLFGIINTCVAGVTIWFFYGKNNSSNKQRTTLVTKFCVVMIILLSCMIYADRLVKISEQKKFSAPIVYATSSPYQRLVVTKYHGYHQLFLNGNLQFSTRDEYRYHEALVHPAMQHQIQTVSLQKPHLNVLVLGGGDGMAVREVLKYPEVKTITLVDLDKKMTDLFSSQKRFTDLNQHSLSNQKVSVINTDAYKWLENLDQQSRPLYDVVIIDLPDPSQYSLAKLYSVPMYKMVNSALASDGIVVVQSTSPYYAPKSFWSINQTLIHASFNTAPYHLYVPSFGEWGFIIAKKKSQPLFTPPDDYQVSLKFLTPTLSKSMFDFPNDMQPVSVKPNTLDKQPLVRYYQEDWKDE